MNQLSRSDEIRRARVFYVASGGALLGIAVVLWLWNGGYAVRVATIALAGVGAVLIAFGLFAPASLCIRAAVKEREFSEIRDDL